MRPRTAKGNFVITRARAKPTEKGPVGTALPALSHHITKPDLHSSSYKKEQGSRLLGHTRVHTRQAHSEDMG